MNDPNKVFLDWSAEVDLHLKRTTLPPLAWSNLRDRMSAFRQGQTPQAYVAGLQVRYQRRNGVISCFRVALWSTAGLGTVLVLFGIIVFANLPKPQEPAGQLQDTPTGQVPISGNPASVEPFDRLTAERLATIYLDNEVAANNRYRGQVVEVTGVVNSVTDDPATVHLSTSADLSRSFNNVACVMAASEANRVANIRQGQSVTLVGKVTGSVRGLRPELENCRLR